MKYNTATPYIASYVILRKDQKIAFVLRANTGWMNGFYGLPSGKTEKNESFLECAIREAKEEIGVTLNLKDIVPVLTVHRKEPSDQGMTWVDVYFEARNWKGEVINAEPEVHSELAWLDPNNLPDNVVPCVKAALEEIKKGKTYSEYGWTKDA